MGNRATLRMKMGNGPWTRARLGCAYASGLALRHSLEPTLLGLAVTPQAQVSAYAVPATPNQSPPQISISTMLPTAGGRLKKKEATTLMQSDPRHKRYNGHRA
jgi:hypothetical protein